MRGWTFGLVAIAIWGASIGALQQWQASMSRIEYLSVPPAVTAHALTAGYENMGANALYLHFVHYFGKHLRLKQKFHNLLPILHLITDLDPQFEGAYVMGGMALGDNGQVDEAEELWAKGVAANPHNWMFAYQAGMSLYLFGNRPDQYIRAAELFHRAGRLPGAPPEARFMEARMYDQSNRQAIAILIWQDTFLNAPSREARAVAERTLKKLNVPLPRLPAK